MALSVTSSQNQKTWDATVRVTGGHPLQLWGIGESQAAAEPGLKLDRVVVRDENDRMVGYGQLQIRRENVGRDGKALLVAECLNVHSNRASTIPVLLDALAEHAAEQWDAALFSVELDAPGSPELVAEVREHGWQRTGETPEADDGPRRLRVNLGRSESDLSSRLSESTLDRCRSGLRVSDVAVREITTRSGDLRAAGLRTEQIGRLLRELGQDSLLLVATQEREGQEPAALGYLWFVHTVGQAMLYRVGFTRAAREMGIDDALLLTGAVELQKRGVQRLDGGDAADPDVPTVVRELADVQRTILGPWRKPLGAETMVAADETSHGAAEEKGGKKADKPGKRRRGLFRSARSQKPEQPEAEPQAPASPEPERAVAMDADAAADRAAAERRRDVRRQISSDLGVEVTDQTPAVTTTGAPASEAAGSEAGAAGLAAAGGSADADRSPRNRSPKAGGKAERKQAKARKRQEAEAQSERAGTPDGKQPGSPAATSVAASTGAAAAEPATAMTAARREAETGPAEDAASEPATQPSQDARQAHEQPAEAATAAAVEEAPVRPVDVDVQAARREREFKAEQRRAERVAQKAEDLEVQQKPKREPIGKRLRREAGGAIRDAMGR
ncbi:hypothetical protein JRG18_04305 [Kocuria palustris]|uniref:hypothetical protein n=1 Tax=Kocuria palustris TaxID=71999 RepID=UPI0019D1826F|nr:hypothetical protein [Kocuria palustris]MBN6752745.1 hypothetical protein [Kocuria palustris]MBN6757700.1 hypothetical protein [Kocuria palustris]MBN6762728.1 hypothetical protein [Kocuria palustris]MBN6782210.1 hypothetical protein [Kocuria palustris]MBN6798681.1 hypothetical protein [Kocuria palustris]